jgi:mono/diheme cytochrome c family protein
MLNPELNPMRKAIVNATVCLLGALAAISMASAAARAEDKAKRGEYLAAIMDCTGCQTPGALAGKPDMARHLGGSDIGFELPGLGVFYPPNLTPDRETGLGAWSAADIIKAVRTGAQPDGRILAPVMPYHSYARLTDADAQALAAFLMRLKPVSHQAPTPVGPSEKATAPYLTVKVP